MKRRNIFELASEYDAADDLFRIKRLLERERSIPQYLCDKTVSLSVYEYVKFTLFKQWKNRGRFIDLTDFLDTINYNELWERALVNPEYYLTCIEIAYNMWYMVARKHSDLHPSEISENFLLLRKNMDDCLAHYNHKAVYSEEKEQLIVIEDKPEATAVAEIVEPELALSVLRYNHYLLKGDLTAKKQILVALGNDLEPKRPQLEALNKNLKDIFFMLNNLNLRHNNCVPEDKNYKRAVADMDEKALEEWYDDLYQMILLAYLELDQQERNNRIKALKTLINGG